jgi:peptidoglycan/xylan/chitin deacetylase (PgdA/CDA1 family)
MTFLSIGCGRLTLIQPAPTPTSEPTWTTSPLPSPTETVTVQPTFPPTETFTPQPSETPLPTFTFTPTDTPVPQWAFQGPGELVVPILLYHHIGISHSDSPYYISTYDFEQQMYLLHQWGYQTISVELLVRAITQGAELPPKPIILTFDDGSETVVTTALPILQKYNFTGTAYIVHNYIGITNYMNADQIRELYAKGWEVGSHSTSHESLTERIDRQRDEIIESRRKLEQRLGIPILTFAYPFGAYDEDSVYYARLAGYIAAMGLGESAIQGSKNLFYLYRKDINGSSDLQSFAASLPWRGDMNNLPIVTVIP